MAEQKSEGKSEAKPQANSVQKDGGMIFLGLRFVIFFGISFFLLSLPYKQRPVFYYLHQNTSKIIVSLTGTNYYKPTFNINKDTIDRTKSQLAAPSVNHVNKVFNQGTFLRNKKDQVQEVLDP